MLRPLAHLNKYLFKYKYYVLLGTLFIFVSNLFTLLPTTLVRESFNELEAYLNMHRGQSQTAHPELTQLVTRYGLMILGYALLKGFFMFLMRQTIIVMSRHIEYDLKNEIYDHYQRLPLSFFQRNNTGDLMARISEDVGRSRMYVGPCLMYGINMLAMVLLIVPFMFSINPRLALYTLLPLPILSVSIYFVNQIVNRRSEQIQRQLSHLSTFVQEAFSGMRVIQAFARENNFDKAFLAANEEYKLRSMGLVRAGSMFFPFMLLMVGLSTILTVYIGSLEVFAGRLTIGNIAEFIIYIHLLTWPMTSIGWISSLTQRAAASQRRINEFLQEPVVKNEPRLSAGDMDRWSGDVVFENVSFRYPTMHKDLIHNISFRLASGESLSVLGAIGSGKTTIAHLMGRLYKPTAGQILLHGHNLHHYDLAFVRRHIGYVPQDGFLFSDSLRNNLLFGAPKTREEDLWQVLRDTTLEGYVRQLPEGLETQIGERGITLSGGQKQRLSMARALLRKPKMLIIDDGLSAVDTRTEAQILRTLKRHMKQRTTFIITHRISAARLAQSIMLIHEGQVQDIGTHQGLFQKKDTYYALCQKQNVTV